MMKNLKKITIKAAALYYTVLISLVITLVLSGIIMLNYLDRKVITIDIQRQKLVDNIKSTAVLLAADSELLGKDSITIDLFDDQQSAVFTDIIQWGAFKIARFKATWRFLSAENACMYGLQIPKQERVGLYMADQDRYLSISGDTKLSGITYLPALGIRRAYIEGSGYAGDELVYGEIKESKKTLPELSTAFVGSHEPYMTFDSSAFDTIIDFHHAVNESRELSNSFLNKTLVLTSANDIYLDRISLRGNIVVASQNAVIATKNTKLEDVLLYGRQIYFLKDFQGRCQAFAADSLFIASGTRLYYPSCAGILNKEGTPVTCHIEDNVLIEGGLILHRQTETANDMSCHIRERTRIRGTVYCNGQVQLEGEVLGSLYLNEFILRTRRAYYENHLLDGRVDPERLSDYFLFGYVQQGNRKSNIITWVD